MKEVLGKYQVNERGQLYHDMQEGRFYPIDIDNSQPRIVDTRLLEKTAEARSRQFAPRNGHVL